MARKNITITLHKSELLYDVQNLTYLTGRSRADGKNHEEVANMQANDDEENQNQILRSIGNAFSELKTKLSEYLSSTETKGDNILTDATGKFSVSLSMPGNYQQSTVETIAAAAHQYIKNSAVADWFTIVNKADAADYFKLAGANLEQIREALNKRVRPTRPIPVP